jgi:hypothetical protein
MPDGFPAWIGDRADFGLLQAFEDWQQSADSPAETDDPKVNHVDLHLLWI